MIAINTIVVAVAFAMLFGTLAIKTGRNNGRL